MSVQIQKGKALESLNLTPLIDVVFLLLIFFLVATRFAQEDRELPVRLPTAANALPMTMEPDELVVNIDENGRYAVGGEVVDIGRLEEIIRNAVVENPIRQAVVIRADRQISVQLVVQVLDLCTFLKVPSYKISTEPPAQP